MDINPIFIQYTCMSFIFFKFIVTFYFSLESRWKVNSKAVATLATTHIL